MTLAWLPLRTRIQRAQRDSGGRCSVTVRFRSGDKLSATVTHHVEPGGWPEGEIHLCTETKTGITTHIIDISEVAAVALT